MSRRVSAALVAGLAAALLHACGGAQDTTDTADDGAGSADAALAAVARAFRRDGVLFGADALDERFGRDGVRIAVALTAPDDLPRFLAAALPVFTCSKEQPAIVYVSPLFRSLLVTRWSYRDGVRLESVHAVTAAPHAGMAHWLDALPDSSSAEALLEARYGDSLQRARDEALCARTRKPATDPAALIADNERDPDLDRVADPSERLGELHRALATLLMHDDSGPLQALGFDVSREALARLPGAQPAVFPVPVSALAGEAFSLVLYADLNVTGRYLLFGHVGEDVAARRAGPTGHVELIALPPGR